MSHPSGRKRRASFIIATALLALVLAGIGPATPAGAAHQERSNPLKELLCYFSRNDTPRKAVDCVGVNGVRRHQLALQLLSDVTDGNRSSGSQGYDASVWYVSTLLRVAGYEVTIDPFEFFAFEPVGPSALEQVAPTPTTYVEDTDFGLLDQTDPGDVTAAVTPVGIELGVGNASTSGCEPEDFAGFPAGNIALLQRGVCTFEDKIENAAAAGASAVVIMNQGNTADPERNEIPAVTFGNGNTSGIPALGTTYAVGASLAQTPGLTLRVFANSSRVASESVNVIADSRYGDDANTVVVGAHLDSVLDGPGINDNGSGTAAILETALITAKARPRNTVRYAFWGAEESGLVGSTDYVNTRTEEELAQIALYLNFDMLGSPNYGHFVYDGDGSDFGLEGPPGSADIEALFGQFYDGRGEPYQGTEIDFRSDYGAFFDAGIPFGGLFSGAEDPKTPEQAALWGGTAGEAFDPCYHAACDTYDNVSLHALGINADSVANATMTYAQAAALPGAAADAGARAATGAAPAVGPPTTGPHATA